MKLANPPFEVKDKKGQPSSINMDIAKALGAFLNKKGCH